MHRTAKHPLYFNPGRHADEESFDTRQRPYRSPLSRLRLVDVNRAWGARVSPLLVLMSAAACSNQITPNLPPTATEIGSGFVFDWPGAVPPRPGPLGILIATPQGAVERPTQVAIVFDRPIRALDAVDTGPTGFSIEPELSGTWSWVGTHAVVFEPDAHQFPRATEYHVRIAEGFAAVDGARLVQSWSQQFRTPHPKLEISECNALTAGPGGGLDLQTDQPVDEAELKRALRVEVAYLPDTPRKAAKLDLSQPGQRDVSSNDALVESKLVYRPLDFTLQRDASAAANHYRILPRQPWPVLSQIRVRVDAGVHSKEGPIPSATAVERICRTVGLPYAEASSSRMESRDGSRFDTVYLDFENPPDPNALLGRIWVTPAARLRVITNDSALSRWHEQLEREANPPRRFRPIRVELTDLRPSTEYRVTIAPGLTGAFGGRTRYAQTLSIVTERAAREVIPGLESGQVEPDRLSPIEVTSSSGGQFEQAAVSLTPEQLLGVIGESSGPSHPLANELLANAWKQQTVGAARLVSKTGTTIDLLSLFEQRSAGGALLYSVRADEAAPARPRWLSLSDLAISAKYSRYGAMIWVTGLKDAEPKPSVTVSALQARGRHLLGTTGQDGSLSIRASEFLSEGSSNSSLPAALLAENGTQWTLLPLGHARANVTRGNTSEDPGRSLIAVFTDRGTYLGGETVFVKGYVHRQTDGKSRPFPNSRVRVSLLCGSKSSQPVAELFVPTSAFGGFTTQFVLPEETPRSSYIVRASVDEAKAESPLSVSEYRPLEFAARAESPEAMVPRQPAEFAIEGHYRSGEPMRGGKIEWSTHVEPTTFIPSGSDGYETTAQALVDQLGSDHARRDPEQSSPRRDARLGEDGKCTVPVSLDSELVGPHRLRLEAEVFDVARNVAVIRAETVVHPAAYYLGIRPISEAIARQSFSVGVRDFDFEGRSIGARPVDVLLFRRAAVSAGPRRGAGNPAPVSRCRLSTANIERSCSLYVPEPGIYVVHAISSDELGRKAQAAMAVFAREARRDASAASSPKRVSVNRTEVSAGPELLLDRAVYHRGDKARLFVQAPFAKARAIVTLEGAGVHFSITRPVERTSEFEIPIPESVGPGLYVNVLLLRDPGRATAQVASPDAKEVVLSQKAIPLRLATDEWSLNVEVKPRKSELLPEAPAVCDLTVRNRLGQPQKAEITLWAVDEQVLSRDQYHVPDLLRTFASQRELLTSTDDSRLGLGWLQRSGYRESDVAAPEGQVASLRAPPSPPRLVAPFGPSERATTTVVFLPEVLTDEQGHARVEFKAPARLAHYRILAQATTIQGEFGTGEGSFSTNLALATRTVMPRFARVLDHFRAGLVLVNQPEVSGDASVRVQADGMDLLESSQRTISLLPDRSREVLFDFKTRKLGTAKIRFDLDANGEHHTVQLDLPILPQQPRQTVALYGETQRARAERIPPLPKFAEGQTELEVSLSRTPLVGLAQSIEATLDQARENTEQLASRLLLLGALRDFSLGAGAKLPTNSNQEIQRVLAELARRHASAWGYAYRRSGPESNWLSTYVHWVLAKSAAVKIPIGAELRFEPRSYLQFVSKRAQLVPRDSIEERVFALEVLSELLNNDREVADAIDELLPKRDRLPLFSQAQLLRAMSLHKQQRQHWAEARESLLTRIVSKLRIIGGRAELEDAGSEYAALLDSKDRTLAFVLRALLVQPSQHPILPAVLRGLVGARKTDTWSSTQASAFALVALAEYQAKPDWDTSGSTGVVWSGKEQLLSAALDRKHWQVTTAFDWHERFRQQPLVFEQRGNGSVDYTARLRFVPAPLSAGAASYGLDLAHSMAAAHDADAAFVDRPVGGELHLCLGDLVQGEVQVFSTRTRHHVLVEVPLPAGLEPVQPGVTEHDENDVAAGTFERPYQTRIERDGIRFYVDMMKPGQVKFRYSARATILGSFALPPARVEEQYNPDHFATTGAGRVIITPR